MAVIISFFVAFVFSFLGSIPPGTLNLTMLQIGLHNKMKVAWRFALACALIEYPYTWLAIEFENLITSLPLIVNNFPLITGVIMIVLGVLTLRSSESPSRLYVKINESGFRRGIVLSLLNPQILPYWIAMTAYIKSQHWTELSDSFQVQAYLLGASFAVFVWMVLLGYSAKKLNNQFKNTELLKKIPAYALIALGIYALIAYAI